MHCVWAVCFFAQVLDANLRRAWSQAGTGFASCEKGTCFRFALNSNQLGVGCCPLKLLALAHSKFEPECAKICRTDKGIAASLLGFLLRFIWFSSWFGCSFVNSLHFVALFTLLRVREFFPTGMILKTESRPGYWLDNRSFQLLVQTWACYRNLQPVQLTRSQLLKKCNKPCAKVSQARYNKLHLGWAFFHRKSDLNV